MVVKELSNAMLYGTKAERAAYSTANISAGWRFSETNTGLVYLWDGTRWIQFSRKYFLEEAYGEYPCYSEFEADGSGVLRDLQGYGTLIYFHSVNGGEHTWRTSTTANDVAGVIATRLSYGITQLSSLPRLRARMVLSKLAGQSDSRLYHGFYAPAAAHIAKSDTPITNSTAGFLIGWRSTDNNFHIFRSDGTTAASPLDTGLAVATSLTFYQIEIISLSTSIFWAIMNDSLTVLASGTISTNIPVNTTQLQIHSVIQNPTGAAKDIVFHGMWIKQDK